jgi:hypothetical protein
MKKRFSLAIWNWYDELSLRDSKSLIIIFLVAAGDWSHSNFALKQ